MKTICLPRREKRGKDNGGCDGLGLLWEDFPAEQPFNGSSQPSFAEQNSVSVASPLALANLPYPGAAGLTKTGGLQERALEQHAPLFSSLASGHSGF